MKITRNKIYKWIKSIDWIFSLKVRLTDPDYKAGRKAAKSAEKSPATIKAELADIKKYWGVAPDLYFRYRLFSQKLSREQLLDYIPKIYFYTRYYKDTYTSEQIELYGNKLSLYKEFLRKGVPTPDVLGVIFHGSIFDVGMRQIVDVDDKFNAGEGIFIKPVDGKGGDGIVMAQKSSGREWIFNGKRCCLNDIVRSLSESTAYVIQKRLRQREDLDRINSSCVNTLRVIVQWRNNKPYIAVAVLRIGRNNNVVDNSAKGGISVQIDVATGKMSSFAHSEHGMETFYAHPDSGYRFSEGRICDWDNICREIEQQSAKFPELKEWAWDVAITETGINMIELNLEYGIEHLQSCCGGMRRVLNVYPAKSIE